MTIRIPDLLIFIVPMLGIAFWLVLRGVQHHRQGLRRKGEEMLVYGFTVAGYSGIFVYLIVWPHAHLSALEILGFGFFGACVGWVVRAIFWPKPGAEV
jgi:hypothetical protein